MSDKLERRNIELERRNAQLESERQNYVPTPTAYDDAKAFTNFLFKVGFILFWIFAAFVFGLWALNGFNPIL